MDEKRVADYFVVAGLPNKDPQLLEDASSFSQEPKELSSLLPITDVTVIIRSQGEMVPMGFQCIEVTPSGFPADLNHGGLRTPSIYLCYRRGRDKPPLVDIGVLCEAKERVMSDSHVVETTPYGRPANISNTGSRLFLTFRRAPETAPCNKLVVTDICVVLTNKGETPPHAFNKIDKNLNKGMVGSDVFICYKKSMNRPDSLCYKPAILGRFPLEDYESFPLPESVALFCLPMGASVECWPKKADQPYPVFSTFVLTSYDAEKVYGSAVTFYEKYPKHKLTIAQKQELYRNCAAKDDACVAIHANKSICLLSRWPFFDTFEKFLRYLHKMSRTGPHKLPIERYVSHFMLDVPFPSPQRPRILIQLPDEMISLTQPQDTLLPLSGASFIQLLRNLRADNCLMVLLFAMTEQKMLFHSLRPDVLTSVAEAVVMLMFPFHWQCPYIPLCPLGLSDVLSAPLPFLVGVDSRYFDLFDPPTDVICIDLDTNNIYIPDDKKWLGTKILPKRPARVLRSSLQRLYEKLRYASVATHQHGVKSPKGSDMAPYDLDFIVKKNQRELEIEIQEAFLRFMAAILKDFRSYLLPITSAPKPGTTDPSSLFNFQGFVKSRDKAYHRYYMKMMKTQMFTRFIEERSFVSDKDASLAFFDECTEKVDPGGESSDVRLLEFDGSYQTDTTVFIAPPEPPSTLGNATPPPTYSYESFGTLKLDLFHRHPATCLLKLGRKSILTSPALLPANSPIGRRTKQEIKIAQKVAKKHSETPVMWAKCLLSYSFSLWFIHLPAYVKHSPSKVKALKTANQVLVMMRKLQLRPQDEVCYRVLMLLCGQYSKPVLAVKVLCEMKHNNVQPNAITYGYYNKAVLESQWPSGDFRAADMWAKLRNVVIGVSKFRKAAREKCRRSQSIGSEIDYEDGVSRTSSIDEDVEGVVMMTRPVKQDSIEGNALMTVEEVKEQDLLGDPSKVDDQNSSGGQSDGGYSSMVQDDVNPCNSNTRLSMDISSDLLGPPEEGEEEPTTQNVDPSNFTNTTSDPLSSANRPSAARSLKFAEIDFTDSDAFRSRVGSIVRNSASSLGSLNHLHDASDSPAGVLMSSYPAVLEEMVIGGQKVHQSRRRHKSAGEHKSHAIRRYSRNHTTSECEATLLNRPANDDDFNSEVSRSNSFGNDVQIIHKLRDEKDTDPTGYLEQDDTVTIVYKNGNNPEKMGNGTGGTVGKAINSIFNLASFKEESEAELDEEDTKEVPISLAINGPSVLPRPRTPNIPVGNGSVESQMPNHVRKTSVERIRNESPFRERKDSLSSMDSHPDNTTFSPIQDAIEFFGTGGLTRMATSLRHSFRWKNSGSAEKPSSKSAPGKVTRSSTFHGPPDSQMGRKRSLSYTAVDGTPNTPEKTVDKKSLSRSSTLPHCTEANAMARFNNESNVNLSPARFITSSASVAGLSKLASRHTELFEGIKSAASTMATKINEMKQTISASATPTRGMSMSMSKPSDLDWLTVIEGDACNPNVGYGTSSASCSASASRRTSVDYLSRSLKSEDSLPGTGNNYEDPVLVEQMLRESPWQRKGSLNGLNNFAGSLGIFPPVCQIIQEETYNYAEKPSSKVALDISMNTLSRCGECSSLLYDEEIMEGWSADESNLNTQCTYCKANFVPHMTIKIKDMRVNGSRESLLTPAHSQESVRSIPLSAPNSYPTPKASVPAEDEKLVLSHHVTNILTPVPVSETPLFTPEAGKIETDNGPRKDVVKMNSVDSCHENFMLFEDSQFDRTSLPRDSPLDSPQKTPEKDLIDLGHTAQFRDTILLGKNITSTSSAVSNGAPSPPFVITKPAPFEPQVENTNRGGKSTDGHSKPMFLLGAEISPVHVDPITVPYLSPLVLRKEVENVLDHEGDDSLIKPEFVDEHPIIYWNLVWYFRRINIPSHLPGLCLRAKSITYDRPIPIAWQKADSRNVSVHCLWDNIRLHEDMGLPMYLLYNQTETQLVHALNAEDKNISKNLMNQILSKIQCNDVLWPISTLISERQKRKTKYHHGCYRELLFLCLVALGQDNIDITAFNREYRKSYDLLTPKQLEMLGLMDRPPTQGAIFCQYNFKPLELKTAF